MNKRSRFIFTMNEEDKFVLECLNYSQFFVFRILWKLQLHSSPPEMDGLADANLPVERLERGRQVHSIRAPDIPCLSPNGPANGLRHRSSQHRAPTRYPLTPARIPALDSSDSASDTEPQSSSEQLSIASTLVVLSSDEDTGNQCVASMTRAQRARQRNTSTALMIENGTNDPPPTSQPTDDNPLTDLQDRQRAPLKQLSRCLENRTRIESPMSEISDEEVDYGSFDSIANPATDSDRAWSPSID